MSDSFTFQIVGALVMICGITLFLVDKREGGNAVKVLGAEVQLSTPSLLVFIVGAALFIFPFTAAFRRQDLQPSPTENATEAQVINSSNEPAAEGISDASAPVRMPEGHGAPRGSATTASKGLPTYQAPPPDSNPTKAAPQPSRSLEVATPIASQKPNAARLARPRDQELWAQLIQSNYPANAARHEQEGRVGVRVDIGLDGKVSACVVSSSSGSADLDAAACEGMKRFARFEPALDKNGDPIASSYGTSIVYRLTESE